MAEGPDPERLRSYVAMAQLRPEVSVRSDDLGALVQRLEELVTENKRLSAETGPARPRPFDFVALRDAMRLERLEEENARLLEERDELKKAVHLQIYLEALMHKRVRALASGGDELAQKVTSLLSWDHLETAADGHFWSSVLRTALAKWEEARG